MYCNISEKYGTFNRKLFGPHKYKKKQSQIQKKYLLSFQEFTLTPKKAW